MRAAIESLRWETGLNVRATLRAPEDVLPGAALFVAIAVAGADHLPLAQAAAAGVPVLVPLQFPSDDAPPGTLKGPFPVPRGPTAPTFTSRAPTVPFESSRCLFAVKTWA